MKAQSNTLACGGFFAVVLWVFIISMILLGVITVYAVMHDSLNTMVTAAGMIYMVLSIGFLSVMAWAFICGHLGGARDIEEPKMQIFALEEISSNAVQTRKSP